MSGKLSEDIWIPSTWPLCPRDFCDNSKLLLEQLFLQETGVSSWCPVLLSPNTVKVLLLYMLAHKEGSTTLNGTKPSYISLITPLFTCNSCDKGLLHSLSGCSMPCVLNLCFTQRPEHSPAAQFSYYASVFVVALTWRWKRHLLCIFYFYISSHRRGRRHCFAQTPCLLNILLTLLVLHHRGWRCAHVLDTEPVFGVLILYWLS